ncbi:MAG TPA: GNAT family N-acetyltransferase [Rhizomicrobium sp.]|nr:GNAT family N-acetyltransferase [Rhizomicrobium sp.]
MKAEDAEILGRICYEAFAAIANAHNFPPDLPNAEIATGLMNMMIASPGSFGVVAEADGNIIGSNFIGDADAIFGVGPITIAPTAQNSGAGTALMRAVLDHAREKRAAGVRLVQAGYYTRSLSLYSKLGFEVREHLSCLQGSPIRERFEGYAVRPATPSDAEVANALCRRVHGHDRAHEVAMAFANGAPAMVMERQGRITGYTTNLAFFGHTVGETTDDVKALIAAAEAFGGPGFLLPSRNGELLRWCLARGLRVTQPMTLMSIGLYNEPAGAWLPSVLY